MAAGDGMAESRARIVAVTPDTAWVEVQPGPACAGGCGDAARAACHPAREAAAKRGPARRVALANDFDAREGETVVVGLPDGTLLRAAFTAYGLPVAGLVAAPLLAAALGAGEGGTAVAAAAGLGAGFAAARRLAGRLADRQDLSPVFVRRP